jgi:hypothetical protein
MKCLKPLADIRDFTREQTRLRLLRPKPKTAPPVPPVRFIGPIDLCPRCGSNHVRRTEEIAQCEDCGWEALRRDSTPYDETHQEK